jgi:hypothetical protein
VGRWDRDRSRDRLSYQTVTPDSGIFALDVDTVSSASVWVRDIIQD